MSHAHAQCTAQVNLEDSLGFNPLQRVHDMHKQARKDTVQRKLIRHIQNWLFAAHALLATTQSGADAKCGNPLLAGARTPGFYRASSASNLFSGRKGQGRQRGEDTWHQVWLTIAGTAISSQEIFRQSMAVIQHVDGGKDVPLSVEEVFSPD